MKFSAALASFGFLRAVAAQSSTTGYWLRAVGGNDITDGKILRSNNTYSPGISNPPYSSTDHYVLLSLLQPDSPTTTIQIVPTNPNPGPIPGYLALNGTASTTDANDFVYKLIQTWHPEDPLPEGYELKMPDWEVLEGDDGKSWLRYKNGVGSWVAVLGKTDFTNLDFWVPYWVSSAGGAKQDEVLAGKQVVSIDLEVLAATPGVLS